jgi:hypothetical protein
MKQRSSDINLMRQSPNCIIMKVINLPQGAQNHVK